MEDDKIVTILSSFGFSFGILTIFGIPFVSNPFFMLGVLGASCLLTPVVYSIAKKSNERWYKKEENRRRYVQQTFANIVDDKYQENKKIGKTTTNFDFKLEAMQNEFNISLEHNDFDQINDFLYLINANYYDKITKIIPQYCREEIIDKVVNQIGLYLEEKNKSSFTRDDVLNILNSCYFIKDDLKKEIYQEFISSEVSFAGGWIGHGIKNRNVDILDEDAFFEQKKYEASVEIGFDIESVDDYKKIIQGIIAADDYLKKFGDVSELDWDLEALKDFLCILLKDHRSDLITYDSNMSIFDIACSYIYNAMCYAVVNEKNGVGLEEMLHTLKSWEKIPFQLRCDVATDVVEQMDLDYSMHPFYQNPVKSKAKIISFDKFRNSKH